MNAKQLNELVETRLGVCRDVLTSAGAEYSDAENDRLSNFKSIADFIVKATGKRVVEITPELIWLIYYLKHVVTLTKAATGQELTREPLGSRVVDAVNYPLLLEALDVDADRKEVEAIVQNQVAAAEVAAEAEKLAPGTGMSIREKFLQHLGKKYNFGGDA